MESTDDGEVLRGTPPELKEVANSAMMDLIPEKSKKSYAKWLKIF